MDDEQHGATSFAPGERATAERIRGTSPTNAVLSRAGDATNAAMAAGADTPPPPRITFDNIDGEVVRRFRPDAPFEAWLILRGQVADARGDLIRGQQLVVATLEFPNADIAHEHVETIEHALALLNIALAQAHAARTEDIPDAATCTHRVRLERFSRRLAFQATCDRCLTVLVPDVRAWLDEHDYGHLADDGHIADSNRQTVRAIIEDAANRGR